MGQEVVCLARYHGQASEGRAFLETDEILFRGEFRLKIPLARITTLDIDDQELIVGFDNDVARFELGTRAAIWIDKIRNPKSLLDKMGITAESRVATINVTDQEYLGQLANRSTPASLDVADVVVYQADDPAELARIPVLGAALSGKRSLWVVTPRGTPGLKDVDVMAVARAEGLVDTKVVRFSATHTALRFVPPKERR